MAYKKPRALSPEQIEEIAKRRDQAFKLANELLDQFSEKYGYSQAETLEALGLSPEEIKKINWSASRADVGNLNQYSGQGKVRLLKARRTNQPDQAEVKVIIRIISDQDPIFAADIFTPAFYDGHGGGNDFSQYELDGSLEKALKLPPCLKK